MTEMIVEQPQKVYVGVGKFLHDQRPAAHAERMTKQYDEKLVPKLHGKAAEVATKLRPAFTLYAKAAGIYQTAAEIQLAAAAVLGSAVLGKNIVDTLKLRTMKPPEPGRIGAEVQYLLTPTVPEDPRRKPIITPPPPTETSTPPAADSKPGSPLSAKVTEKIVDKTSNLAEAALKTLINRNGKVPEKVAPAPAPESVEPTKPLVEANVDSSILWGDSVTNLLQNGTHFENISPPPDVSRYGQVAVIENPQTNQTMFITRERLSTNSEVSLIITFVDKKNQSVTQVQASHGYQPTEIQTNKFTKGSFNWEQFESSVDAGIPYIQPEIFPDDVRLVSEGTMKDIKDFLNKDPVQNKILEKAVTNYLNTKPVNI